MWSMFVDGISQLLTQMALWFDGSYGLAIIAMALLVRCALLPMTLRTAEQAWLRQRQIAGLKPQLDRLRERHANEPLALAQATQALHREHGINAGLRGSLLTLLIQAPLGAGVYAAIRQGVAGAGAFLWIPKLARPDIWLAFVVALLSYAALLVNPAMSEQTRMVLQLLPVLFAFFMVWHLAAGLGLYWASSGGVALVQALLLRRRVRRLV